MTRRPYAPRPAAELVGRTADGRAVWVLRYDAGPRHNLGTGWYAVALPGDQHDGPHRRRDVAMTAARGWVEINGSTGG